MTKIGSIGLGGFAVLLLSVIAGEALEFTTPALTPSGQTERAAVSAKPDVPGASTNAAAADATQIKTILGRPLFSQDRTAPADDKALASDKVPRLTGIVISPAGKFALFAPDGGKALMIAQGQTIGPYTVRLIDADGVTVSGPAGQSVLHPAFANGKITGDGTTAPAAAPTSPFSQLSALPNLPAWLKPGTPDDLPSAATWSGPAALSRLPVSRPHPASTPLLQPAPTATAP